MISIAALGNGPTVGEYYLRRQAGCEMDYYTGHGERRGVWCGAGSLALGLTGELSEDGERIFRALLAGCGPAGSQLVKPVLRSDPRSKLDARPLVEAVRRTAAENGCGVEHLITDSQATEAFSNLACQVDRSPLAAVRARADVAEQIALAAGIDVSVVYGAEAFTDARARVGARIDVRRAGYDVVFSAPKSVSVLYGLADNGTSEQVREAHAAAVAEALAYLERHVARAVRGHHGDGTRAARISTDGLMAAAFEHRSSRSGDPQLHTHVVIANLIRGVDGRWSAIDSRALFRHELTAGYIYQAVLRGELTQRLGVGWGEVGRGVAELDGVPRPLCRAFSQRRQMIEARLAQEGREGAAAARQVCVETRPAKTHVAEQTLRDQWTSRAHELGFDPAVLSQLVDRVEPTTVDSAVVTERLLAADGLTYKRSVFDARDVLRGVCEAIPPGARVDLPTLIELAGDVVRGEDAVAMLAPTAAGGRAWSTRELLATEQAALALVDARRSEAVAVVPAAVVAGTLSSHALSPEQVGLVRSLVGSGAGVEVVVGPAGAGKTHALRAARDAWQRAGYQVVGTALAAIAARELERGAGIPATSLARFLGDIAANPLTPRTVLVVDEASMVGTRQLARLLDHAAAARAKVVLVGDPCQLPEIEAGGLFAALASRRDALTLGENHRQAEAWERAALSQLRDGDVETGLAAYAAHDRVQLAATGDDLRTRIVADLLAARAVSKDGDVVILTSRRSDATRLNAAVRDYLRAQQLIGPAELVVTDEHRERAFSAGDQVVVTRNDYRRGLLNGTRGAVTTVDPRGRWLDLATRDGEQVRVAADWVAARLDHAYAITCHRAQGMTIDTALVYGTAALCREAAYVALSRGRRANYIYASADDLSPDTECDLADHPTGERAAEAALVERAGEALSAALGKSRRQRLALDQHPDSALDEPWVVNAPRVRRDSAPRARAV